MGMATEQDLKVRPVEKAQWSARQLFPFTAVKNAFTKTFVNVFDVLLGFTLLVIGAGELFGRNISWLFYAITLALMVAAYNERHFSDTNIEKT